MIQIKSYAKPKKTGTGSAGSGGGFAGGPTANVTNNYNTVINASADDWFYWNSSENSVHCRYVLVGDSEVAAWGLGNSSGGSGGSGCSCIVIDNLTSNSSTDSLSANQGRVLKEMIDNLDLTGGGDGHVHTNKSTLDKITETDLSNWIDASNLRHSHDNLDSLDKITDSSINTWNNAANNSHSHSNKSALD